MDLDSFTSSAPPPSLGSPTATTLPAISQILGFVVPGGPVRTDFAPSDPSGTKLTLVMQAPGDLPLPLSTVPEVMCFLLPNAPLPPDFGVLIYWQISPSSGSMAGVGGTSQRPDTPGFELLGAVTPTRPSGIFRTGWGLDERIQQMEHAYASTGAPVKVTLGVSIEPLSNVLNLQQNVTPDNRLFVAQKIANDLFQFMRSFDTGGTGSMMTVPTNIFDRWMRRFENRFQRDPNFFMKQGDN